MAHEQFADRHIGPDDSQLADMLRELGFSSLDELTDAAVPPSIRSHTELDLPDALTEPEALRALRALADQNEVFTSLIGMGYSGTITPGVILRNVLENPAWYTAYTPYQPEISQGRLEVLLNFQTMTPTPDPWVTGVSPGAGPTAGGDLVTITGTHFMGVTSARFDGIPGTQLHVANDTKLTVKTPPHAAGTYRVRLIAPGRSSARNAKALYTFVTTPVVSDLAPHGGPLAGGTSVSITGSGFTDVTSVKFDGVPGTNLEVLNSSTLSVDTPAHAAGTVRVRIFKRGSSSARSDIAQFTYQTAPTITGLTPSSGGVNGTTNVTITGTGFVNVQDVYFGTGWVSLYDVVSSTEITAVVNGQPAGTVSATVITDGGTSTTSSAGDFTFVPAPTVAEIAPDTGGTGGFDIVTITGANFTGTTAVTFGGDPVDSFTVDDDTQITVVTAPSATAGPVDVEITTPFGSVTEIDGFTYVAPPVITGVSPASGTVDGGTSVVITGTGFNGVDDILFGGSAVTSGSDMTDTSMTVTTPAHSSGTVSITVITPYGSVTLPNGFTYTDS